METTDFKIKQIELTVTVTMVEEGELICLASDDKCILGGGLISSGKTLEEATKKFWWSYSAIQGYYRDRSNKLDRYTIQFGPWSSIGGKWFSIFGIFVSFRIGKGMKGGWYVPFTKLNISITNYWKKVKK